MRVDARIQVAAPSEAVWRVITDPAAYLHVMAGMTRWEAAGEQDQGVGARFRVLMRVRSAEVGGLIEVVEWNEPRELAWTSVTGLDQRGRWRLRERAPNRTDVEFRLSYGVAGSGVTGWLAEWLASPTVRGNLRASLRALKRRVEHDEARRRVAERREARAGAR